MKQTAAEWLFEKLWNTDKDKFTWYAILKQAEEMERDQIIDAYQQAEKDNGKDFLNGDLYYNETYKSEQ